MVTEQQISAKCSLCDRCDREAGLVVRKADTHTSPQRRFLHFSLCHDRAKMAAPVANIDGCVRHMTQPSMLMMMMTSLMSMHRAAYTHVLKHAQHPPRARAASQASRDVLTHGAERSSNAGRQHAGAVGECEEPADRV